MSSALAIQRTGRKPGNRASGSQDRLKTRTLSTACGSPAILLAVADGITTGAYGGSVARYIVDRHLAVDDIEFNDATDALTKLPLYLTRVYETFKTEFADMPDMLMSGACLVAILIIENQWVCCSVGDCEAFVLRRNDDGFTGKQITRSHLDRLSGKLTDCFGSNSPCKYNVDSGRLEDKSILVLTSDGAKLDDFVLADAFKRHGFAESALSELAENAMGGRYWDDISIIAYRH